MRKIWWIASYPKSGNTWVRFFLAAYRTGVCDINRCFDAALDDIQPYFHQAVSPLALDEMTSDQHMLVRGAALLHMVTLAGPGEPMFVKTHFMNCTMSSAFAIPVPVTHGAIYLMRDPRDVAVSFADHVGVDIDTAIGFMNDPRYSIRRDDTALFQHLGRWSDHVQSWAGVTEYPVCVIRYEDLLKNPVKVFGGLLSFLGESPDEKRLAAAVDLTRFDNMKVQEEAAGFREKSRFTDTFFKRGTSGGWRDVLTAEQAKRLETNHDITMRQFGYLAD